MKPVRILAAAISLAALTAATSHAQTPPLAAPTSTGSAAPGVAGAASAAPGALGAGRGPGAPGASGGRGGRGPAAPLGPPALFESRPATLPNAKPLWPTQTRAPQADSKVAYKTEVVASGLANPWGLAFLPDGKLLVSERSGGLRVIDRDGKASDHLTGVPPVLARALAGQFDVVLDPGFAKNRRVYLSYNEPVDGGSNLAVARGVLNADETGLDQVTVIFRVTPVSAMVGDMGGRLLFDRTGNLMLTAGDETNRVPNAAQLLDNDLGKVMRITTDGAPAPGNPKIPGARPEIYTIGVRDPEGITFDDKNRLWVMEHGPKGGDEIFQMQPGKNYGWPVVSYGLGDNGQPVGQGLTTAPGIEQPIYYWDPAVGASGLTYYKANLFPTWKNSLLACALTGRFVAHLTLKNDKVVSEERLFTELNERFRNAVVGPDGALYLLADNAQAKIYKVTPK